jgi:hypothetical protein
MFDHSSYSTTNFPGFNRLNQKLESFRVTPNRLGDESLKITKAIKVLVMEMKYPSSESSGPLKS